VVLIADGAWTFGWSALVAFGTIGLASVTGWLAWSTRNLARETSEEIVSSYRPVIVPGPSSTRTLMDEAPNGLTLRVGIRNAGAGPASFIRASHDPSDVGATGGALGSLAPGEETSLVFFVGSHTAMSQVLFDYRNLDGRTYSSAIILFHPDQAPTENIVVRDVQFGRDVSFTGFREPDPLPGLRRLPTSE
jgi:hypothetical protein